MLDTDQLLEQFKELRVKGRKTLFTAVVEAIKGFLTAEKRDRMANIIRPEYPLPPPPPVTTAATSVVTRAGEVPPEVLPQPPVTAVVTLAPMVTVTTVVTAVAVITTTTTTAPVTTTVVTSVTVTATTTPVTAWTNITAASIAASVPVSIMSQIDVAVASQQSVLPVGGTEVTESMVLASETVALSQSLGNVVIQPYTIIPPLSGVSSVASQGQLSIGTSVVPSGSQQPLSHPIVIEPTSKRPHTGVIIGVETLTLAANPNAMITATVARMIAPVNPQTSLLGLAGHQAVGAVSAWGLVSK